MVTKNYDIYFDKLNLEVGAPEEKIKKAYKKLALKYHPDKNQGDEEATKKFLEIGEAYEKLMRMLRGEFSSDEEDYEFNEKEAELARLRQELERERRKEKRRKEQERWEEEFREEQTRKRLQREREEREEEFRLRTEQMRRERENMERTFKERIKRTMSGLGTGLGGSGGGMYTSYSSYTSPSSSYSTYSFSSDKAGDDFTSFSSFYKRGKDNLTEDAASRTSEASTPDPKGSFKENLKFVRTSSGYDAPDEHKLTPEYGTPYSGLGDRAKSSSPTYGRRSTGYTSGYTSSRTDSPFGSGFSSNLRRDTSGNDENQADPDLGSFRHHRSYLFSSNLNSPTISVEGQDEGEDEDPMRASDHMPFSSYRYSRSKSSNVGGDDADGDGPKPFASSSYLFTRLSHSTPTTPRHSFSTNLSAADKKTGEDGTGEKERKEPDYDDIIAKIKKERGEEEVEKIDSKLDQHYEDLIAKIKRERGEVDEASETLTKIKMEDDGMSGNFSGRDSTYSSRYSSANTSPYFSRKSSLATGLDYAASPTTTDYRPPSSTTSTSPPGTTSFSYTSRFTSPKYNTLDDELDSYPTRDYSSLPRRRKPAETTDTEDAPFSFNSLPRRKPAGSKDRFMEQMEWEKKFLEETERRRKAREEEEKYDEERLQFNLRNKERQIYADFREKQRWGDRFTGYSTPSKSPYGTGGRGGVEGEGARSPYMSGRRSYTPTSGNRADSVSPSGYSYTGIKRDPTAHDGLFKDIGRTSPDLVV